MNPTGDDMPDAREWLRNKCLDRRSDLIGEDLAVVLTRNIVFDGIVQLLDEFAAHRSAADRQRIAELERDIEDFIAFRDHCHQLGMRWHNVPDGWRDWATLVNRRADSDESELEKLRGLLRRAERMATAVDVTANGRWSEWGDRACNAADRLDELIEMLRRALSGEERDSQESPKS